MYNLARNTPHAVNLIPQFQSWSWSWSWSCKLIISNPHVFNPILQFRNQAMWRSRVINETLDDIVIVISYFFQIPLELNNFIYQIFPQIIWVCWF